MSKKQWILLLGVYVTYLLLGAAIFYYIESEEEIKRTEEEKMEKDKLEDMIREHFQGNYSIRRHLFSSLSNYCGKPFGNENTVEYKWDFYHSLFFVITVVSTIGYGNLAPTTMFTRLFMIFYGLIGIPMNGIVIFTLGEYFGKSFTKLHQRWKNSKIDYDDEMAKLGLVSQVVLYLVPGFTFFIFLPSTIMTVFEGWEYDISVYYSFVSLTTIGFGDYVAGTSKSPYFSSYYAFYKIFLLVWIIGGMGYLAMLLSFITRGMRSEKVKIIERILTENIKNTPKKIRAELQSILHELLFLRVKPVYKDEFDVISFHMLNISKSCPNLTIFDGDLAAKIRKRAISEGNRPGLQKSCSDSNLDKIDKEKTFSSSKRFLEQTDLLFKVVGALSSETLPEINSTNSFIDNMDLDVHVRNGKLNNVKKRRAISDIRPPNIMTSYTENLNTWYGADAEHAIQEYRRRYASKSQDLKKSAKDTIFKKIKKRLLSRDETNKSDIEKQNFSSETVNNDNHKNGKEKESTIPVVPNQILESTSIADFIRALSVVTAPDLSKLETSRTRKESKVKQLSFARNTNRRSSIGCASLFAPEPNPNRPRRLSLKPVEECVLTNPIKFRETIRKNSTQFQEDRRNSLLSEASIPPTVQEHVPYSKKSQTSNVTNTPVSQRTRKFSVRRTFDTQ